MEFINAPPSIVFKILIHLTVYHLSKKFSTIGLIKSQKKIIFDNFIHKTVDKSKKKVDIHRDTHIKIAVINNEES